jgi:hypothetical protein
MNARRLCAIALTVAAVVAVGSVPSSAQPGFTVVASGLDNPRDLAFAPNGQLFVAEAGHGGSDCAEFGEEGTACVGFTSGISVVDIRHGRARQVVSGLASLAGDDGSFATGLDGISFHGMGGLYGIMAGSADSIPPDVFTAADTAKLKAQVGRVIKATPSGQWKTRGDVGDTDFRWSADHPDLVPGQFPDANPYGILAGPGGQWIVDAGSNTIDRVRSNGSVSVEAFIPNPASSDSVPTCVERGPDGALYIGELTGGGNGPGASRVWRFVAGSAHPLTVWATGLTAVTGCGFGPDGRFYATEFSTHGLEDASPGSGAVVRVPPHSTSPVLVAGGLSFPGGFAAGPDGSLYVSNWSIAPSSSGLGAVVRIST